MYGVLALALIELDVTGSFKALKPLDHHGRERDEVRKGQDP